MSPSRAYPVPNETYATTYSLEWSGHMIIYVVVRVIYHTRPMSMLEATPCECLIGFYRRVVLYLTMSSSDSSSP